MKVPWLQVPVEAVEHYAPQLAHLLTLGSGRKVSEGDALLFIIRLWQWALVKVNPDAEDLRAEFESCSSLSRVRAAETLATACRWPISKADVLLESLLDSEVRVLVEEGDCVRVDGLAERYTALAEKQRDNRGRSLASKLAKAHGWTHRAGVGYVSPQGEIVRDWREIVALLGDAK